VRGSSKRDGTPPASVSAWGGRSVALVSVKGPPSFLDQMGGAGCLQANWPRKSTSPKPEARLAGFVRFRPSKSPGMRNKVFPPRAMPGQYCRIYLRIAHCCPATKSKDPRIRDFFAAGGPGGTVQHCAGGRRAIPRAGASGSETRGVAVLAGELPDEFELVSKWTVTLSLMPRRDRATRQERRRG
jgi:hypothetical protein